MLEKIYPVMSAAGLQPGQQVSEEALRRVLGPALWVEADQLTESIVANVNEDVQSVKDTFDKLRLALVKALPGQMFIRVEFDMPP
jgi:hypothetical protein